MNQLGKSLQTERKAKHGRKKTGTILQIPNLRSLLVLKRRRRPTKKTMRRNLRKIQRMRRKGKSKRSRRLEPPIDPGRANQQVEELRGQ